METALIRVLVAAGLASAAPVYASDTILVNRIGPSASELFVANADGSGERKLFPSAGFDYDASFSADGKWIVFTSERNRCANIYRARVDGSGLEQLTNNNGFDDQAALSPDGKQLAFVSTRGGGSANIWILNMKSKKVRNLTATLAPGGNYRPAWSPDGRWIAFSSDRNIETDRDTKFDHAKGRWEHLQAASLYVIRPDGKDLRRITPGGRFAGSPKWSPDGQQLVYYELPVEDSFAARGMGVSASQIVSVDIATGARKEHTSGPGMKISPQFLAAERIGYLVKAGPKQHGGLAFTTGERGPDQWIRNPSWSQDGTAVVYQKWTYASRLNAPIFTQDAAFDLRYADEFPAISSTGKLALSPLGGPPPATPPAYRDLSVMDLDGENAKRIFSEPGGRIFAPAWSPDAQWIAFGFGAFFTERETKPAQLMMVRADGSEKRNLTNGPVNSGFPSWSPDGKHIAYRIWTKDEVGIRILNLEDGSTTKLTSEADNFPSWSPGGDRIAFTRAGKNAFDIFTIRPDGTGLKQLTDAPGNDAHSAWSPDGQSIIFSSSRLGYRDEAGLYDGAPQPYAELFIMKADGSGQRPITDDKWEEGTPAWVSKAGKTPVSAAGKTR